MTSPASQSPTGQASKVPSEYEALLTTAQAAQARADRAVADLAGLKRSLSELPRTIESRREEFERVRQMLERLETQMLEARQLVPVKQAEAARAIEEAANAQRALAHALIQDDTNLDASQIRELTTASRPAPVMEAAPVPATRDPVPTPRDPGDTRGADNRAASAPYFAASKPVVSAAAPLHGTFIAAPKGDQPQHEEDVAAFMVDRDLLCPSCGAPLRGVKGTRCPGCRLSLSVPMMRSVAPGLFDAQPAVWAIRVIGLIAIGLALFLGVSVLTNGRPKGCGVGSDCHFVVSSPWSKLFGIPVSIPGILLYVGILVTTCFTRVGLRDVIRRRAWMVLCVAGAMTALTGLWFVFIQTVILKAFCPFCLIVDLMGILTGVVVLLKAPLGRREPLPRNAIGAIAFPRGLNVKLLVTGVVLAIAFMGAHLAANSSKKFDRKEFSKLGEPEKKDDGGLMMGGLELKSPPKAPEKPEKPESRKTEPPKSEPVDQKDKAGSDATRPGDVPRTSEKTSAQPTEKPSTATTKPDPAKAKSSPEENGGLLVPALELKSQDKPKASSKAEPESSKATDDKPIEASPDPDDDELSSSAY